MEIKLRANNYVTDNFRIEEFVSKATFTKWGRRSIYFVDPRLILLMQAFREHLGRPITINNWYKPGGTFNNRGYREPNTSIGGYESQHKFGRAADFNVQGMTAAEVYAEIMKHKDKFINAGLTCVEDVAFTPGWTHVDLRWHDEAGESILIVKP